MFLDLGGHFDGPLPGGPDIFELRFYFGHRFLLATIDYAAERQRKREARRAAHEQREEALREQREKKRSGMISSS